MSNWFYYDRNDEKVGPISATDLKALVQQGVITRRTIIESENGRMAIAGNIKGLTFPATETPSSPSDKENTESMESQEPAIVEKADISTFESLQQTANNGELQDKTQDNPQYVENRQIYVQVKYPNLKSIKHDFDLLPNAVKYHGGMTRLDSDINKFDRDYPGHGKELKSNMKRILDSATKDFQRRVANIRDAINRDRKKIAETPNVDPQYVAELEKVAREFENYVRTVLLQ